MIVTFFGIAYVRRPYLLFICTVLLLSAACLFPASGQRVWQVQRTGTSSDLRGITYGGGLFVTVGDKGTILTSPDGTTWTPRNSPTVNALYKVVYGAGQFVAVGENVILTSADGLNWTARQPAADYVHLRGISYGGGKYVAVAGFSGVLTSANGIDWTARSTTSNTYLAGVGHGRNVVVTVGGEGTVSLLPPDNARPTKKTCVLPTTTPSQKAIDFADVSYGGDRFVAVGAEAVLVSSDGTYWAKAGINQTAYLYGVSYGGKQFVAVGYNGAVQTSPDGTSWTAQPSNTTQVLYGVSCGGSRFVAVGAEGTIISADVSAAYARSANPPADSLLLKPTDQNVTGLSTPAALISETERPEQVVVYPNPSDSGRFRLVLPNGTRRVSVSTGQGQTLIESTNPSALSEVDLSRFAGGVYWLRVETDTTGRVLKLIKR